MVFALFWLGLHAEAAADEHTESGEQLDSAQISQRVENEDEGPTESAEAIGADGSRADDPPGYRELVVGAIAAREAGRHDDAVRQLEQAHALFPNARTLRGLGVLAMDGRQYREAAGFLRAALDAAERPLEGNLREVTVQLLAKAEAALGRVSVSVRPSSAVVKVDGVPELSPGRFEATVGTHALLVTADGYLDEARNIEVQNANELRLELALIKAAPAAPLPTERKAKALWRNPWLWGSLSAVVVGGIVAGVLIGRDEPGYERGSSGMLVGKR